MLVAMFIEDMLQELGYEVVGPAMRLEDALEAAAAGDFDFAMLDINLGGTLSFPVADVLRERGIPFLFSTGYGSKGLSEEYRGSRTLKKPFRSEELGRAILEVACSA